MNATEGILTWTHRPAKERPVTTRVLVALVVGAPVAWVFYDMSRHPERAFETILSGAFATAINTLVAATHLSPKTYTLSSNGVEVRGFLTLERRPWASFPCFVNRGRDIHLSVTADPNDRSWRNAGRGFFLPFPPDLADAITTYVAQHLPEYKPPPEAGAAP